MEIFTKKTEGIRNVAKRIISPPYNFSKQNILKFCVRLLVRIIQQGIYTNVRKTKILIPSSDKNGIFTIISFFFNFQNHSKFF